MIYRVILFSLLGVSTAVSAQDQLSDPFDLSDSRKKYEEIGLPVKSEVDQLENRSKELFNSDNCQDAIGVLNEYAKRANHLANLIAKGLEPYYDASRDERNSFGATKTRELVPFETLSNDYKQKRNMALAMIGECHIKLGEKEKAVPYLLQALELIDIDNEVWWVRTRENLYTILGVQ